MRATVGFGHCASLRSIPASTREIAQVLVAAVSRRTLHPVEIGTGAEALAGTRNHQHAHRGIDRHLVDGRKTVRRSGHRRRHCAARDD